MSRSARSHRLRLPVAAGAAIAASLALAAPAFAHIHTDPSAVEAGAEATVGFIIEHGCEDSPTTKMEIQLPEGATDIAGVDEEGFTSEVDGQVVTFTGGSIPDGTEHAFKVSFMAPPDAGEVPVKVIQTCETGSLEWIQVQAEGEAEPEHPAPLLMVTEGAPTGEEGHGHGETTETTEAEHGHDEATTTEAGHHEEEATTTEAEADHHEEDAAATEGADEADSDSGSSAGLIAGLVAALVVIGGGSVLYLRSRKAGDAGAASDSGSSDGPTPEA